MLCGSFFRVELGVNQSLVCLGIKKFIQQANFTLAYSPRQCKKTDEQPEIIISQLILMSTQRKEARSQCGKRIRVLITLIRILYSTSCCLHFKIIISSLRICDRFFVLMCHPGQLLKVGKRVVKCGLIVNSVNYSLSKLDLKLLENFKKPLNPTLSQFSDQGFCNTWLVTKIKFNLSAKSKARHCLIIVFCWAKILHNSISC